MERFDVFVIGGGGTGSEVAFQLAQRSDLRVAIAERDKLGSECSHHGCVPTKVMLRSAKIARLARDAIRGARRQRAFGHRREPVRAGELVADARSGELLGGHIVGEEAGAIIHQVVAAMSGRVPTSAIGDAIHAYPTLSESVKGAFLDLAGRP
jgi:pyruvate/2-oxoglutarate dehydrogenase complex dihydrolipoamide dehydrogenase (E3) component